MAEYKTPKKVKFRRHQRGRRCGNAKRGTDIAFGEFALKATEAAWITGRQIEAGRIAINRHVKRGGKLWIRVFPDKPITKKPAETRMGKGKGAPPQQKFPIQCPTFAPKRSPKHLPIRTITISHIAL